MSWTFGKWRFLILSREAMSSGLVPAAGFGVSPRTTAAPTSGATPSRAITFLLLMFFVIRPILSPVCRRRLRIRFQVPGVVDFEEHHHRVVFVDDVVAVHREQTLEVAEAEVELGLHVVLKPEHVLAPRLDDARGGRGHAVALQRLELLEMHVDGVLPPARVVLEDPLLGG